MKMTIELVEKNGKLYGTKWIDGVGGKGFIIPKK